MSRYLALDHGQKRIGVSISDEAMITAQTPEPPLVNDNQLLQNLKKIIRNYKIKKIILGNPLGLSGQLTEQTQTVGNFKIILTQTFNLPVSLVDERYTSKQAGAMLQASGLGGREVREHIDNQSARILLQEFLNSNKE